jgi:hypothetical protein
MTSCKTESRDVLGAAATTMDSNSAGSRRANTAISREWKSDLPVKVGFGHMSTRQGRPDIKPKMYPASALVSTGPRLTAEDLAALREVEVKALNQAVRRNAERFPADFMFRLTGQEGAALGSQIVTSNNSEGAPGSGRGGRRHSTRRASALQLQRPCPCSKMRSGSGPESEVSNAALSCGRSRRDQILPRRFCEVSPGGLWFPEHCSVLPVVYSPLAPI